MSTLKTDAVALALLSCCLVAMASEHRKPGKEESCSTQIPNSDFDSPKLLLKFSFNFSGPRPADYLSSAYQRIAQCAPAALPVTAARIERRDIFKFAQNVGSFPGGESATPAAFETAVGLLTRNARTHETDNSANYFIPTARVEKKPEPLQQRIKPEASQKLLDNICVNVGKPSGCVSRSQIKKFVGIDHKLVSYISIDHYRLSVDVYLPREAGMALANDVLQFVVNKNVGLRDDAENLPTFDIQGAARSDSACTESKAKDVLAQIDWSSKLDASASKVLVVERQVPGAPASPIPLSDLKHPFFSGSPLAGVPRLPAALPTPESDQGHSFHVAHTIGARGVFEGWSGMATNADVRLAGFTYFTRDYLNARKEILGKMPGSPIDFYRIVNLSVAIDDGVCDIHKVGTNHVFQFERIRAILRKDGILSRSTVGAPLYVFAASTAAKSCIYTDDDGDRPRSYDKDNCGDLSCLGRLPNSITVVPLAANFASVRSETRDDLASLALAAPGTGIVGADLGAAGEMGFRSRCGSSHAAPIVSSVATALASKYNLGPALIKSRLFSTARMLAAPSSLPGEQIHVVGILDGDRAIGTDPALDTVWLMPNRSEKKFEGRVSMYGGNYPLTPPNDQLSAIKGGGATMANLVAIKRIWPRPGEIAKPLFRSVLRNDDLEYQVSAAYSLDKTASGESICEESPKQGSTKACVAITRAGTNEVVLVDVADIDSIIMRSH